MNKLILVAFASIALPLSAATVVVTPVVSNEGTQLAMDLRTDGNVAAFSFRIDVPKSMQSARPSLGSCVSQLPAGWSGACNFTKGAVYVFAESTELKPLPAGLQALGTVSLNGSKGPTTAVSRAGVPEKFAVKEISLSDASGVAVKTGTVVAE